MNPGLSEDGRWLLLLGTPGRRQRAMALAVSPGAGAPGTSWELCVAAWKYHGKRLIISLA